MSGQPARLPAPPASLGRLGEALRWLAAAQGSWPPQPPVAVRSLVVDGGSLAAGTALADDVADAGVDLLVLAAGADADPVPGLVAVAVLRQLEPVAAVGTAATAGWTERTVAVRDGLRSARQHVGDPTRLVAAVGDGALGQLVGLLARSAARRTPVVLDGSVLGSAAALLAARLRPGSAGWWLAGQAPSSAAGRAVQEELRLPALLDLGLERPEAAQLAADLLLGGVELARD